MTLQTLQSRRLLCNSNRLVSRKHSQASTRLAPASAIGRTGVLPGRTELLALCAPGGVNVCLATSLACAPTTACNAQDIAVERCPLVKQVVSTYPGTSAMHDQDAQNDTAELLDEAIDWDELLQLAATYDNGTELIEPELVRASHMKHVER